MIVNQTDWGWEIINQQAHGLLAVQMALHWQPDSRPVNWAETLVALTEHDDGQDPWEGRRHLTKVGAPLPFQIPQYSVDQCRRMIEIGLQKSYWNALLLSMHTSFLYESKRGSDKALDKFLDEQVANQTKWRKHYKVIKAEAQYAYDFVQWFDALSLILCLNQVPVQERRLEISTGPDGTVYFILQRRDGSLCIDPWPFDVQELAVHVETFQLSQVVFSNDNELRYALQKAPVVRKEWVFKKYSEV
ncbi:DUF3891 family protein [Spirosoma sp. SC4-14]|uniref:DUF3891 family protein n=1 Tax=Spirosoma sp. SC4-14 TaxID=3128900 RepID=UPI0030CDCD13